MKIRKIYTTIGLLGVLTTSFLSAISALELEAPPPATKEKDQLMSKEEMAHKMMLFNEAKPKMPNDIARGHIGPTLHAVNVKTFTCPTTEELQHVAFKNTGKQFALLPIMEFEKNGIYYETVGPPPVNVKFNRIEVGFEGPENKVTGITCTYYNGSKYYSAHVIRSQSQLEESLVTFSQNDMKLAKIHEDLYGRKSIILNKNIEFTMQPVSRNKIDLKNPSQ